MQYLSGVWESLTGQANAKRKRTGDEAEALPDRMTTLKLFSGQCAGRPVPHHPASCSEPSCERSLFDENSSAASQTHLQSGSAYCASSDRHAHHRSWDDQSLQFKLPPPPQPQSQPHTYSCYVASSSAAHSSNGGSAQPSVTAYRQHPYTYRECSNQSAHVQPSRTAQHALSQSQPHHAFHPGVHRSSRRPHSRSADRQASAQTACHQPGPQAPATSTDLCCSEVLSPVTHYKAPVQSVASRLNSSHQPSPDLTESVADSPDGSETLEDIASSPSHPIPGVLSAFLALCQAPQVTTALSKLQATHQLPCPTTLSVLPLDMQHCSMAMSTELFTAGTLVQGWSKASQLEWTLAGMFALCLRAELDPPDLDCIMLLSLLWLLGEIPLLRCCALLAT